MRRDLIGETLLNQFRVETYIASGGMATIYRVWDLQRSVPLAMKVLHPELADDPSFMSRFQREASSLQTLVHPHIVPFYGLYRAADLTFLLERYVDGPSLDEILRQRAGRPLSLRDTLVYFKALYTSLGYAHNQGIIHCDVKPGNVLIDQGGHIYLTDFGIARYKDSSTTTSSALGTPLYMAPEQVRGERVTPQSDIYSLGVLLFELLTGQRPFRGDGDIPQGVGGNISDRVRYQQLYTPAPDPRTLNPSVPEGLARITLRAMDKQPDQRYPTVQAMADDISRAVAARLETLPDRVNLAEEWNVEGAPGPAQAENAAPGRSPDEEWREGNPWQPVVLQPGSSGPDYQGGPEYPGGSDYPGGPDYHGSAGSTLPGHPEPLDWQPRPGWEAPAPVAQQGPVAHTPRRTPLRLVPLLLALALLFLCGLGALGLARLRGMAQAPGPQPTSSAPTLPGKPVGKPTATPHKANPPTKTQPPDPAQPTETPQSTSSTPVPTSPAVVLSDFAVPGQIAFIEQQEGVDRVLLLDAAQDKSEAVPGVANVTMTGATGPAWSPDGSRLAWIASYKRRQHIVVMDLNEREPYQLAAGEAFARLSAPAWLPDGARVSFWASGGGGTFLVLADAKTGQEADRISLPDYRNLFAWNWQNNLLAFIRQENNLYQVVISGSPTTTSRPLDNGGEAYAPSWSKDGSMIAFQSNSGRAPGDDQIWVARADGSDMHAVTNNPEGIWSRAPSWSPDGQFIVFVSNLSGSLTADYGELFALELSSGKIRQLSSSGGQVYDWRPAWRP